MAMIPSAALAEYSFSCPSKAPELALRWNSRGV